MTTPRTFRPAVGDRLEDRTVPSGLGVAFGNAIGDLPSQDARQVVGEFNTFDRSFQKDFRAYVSAVKAGESTAASTFTTALGNDFSTLNGAVDHTIANLAANNPSLASSVDTALGSLKSELTALTLPTTTTRRATSQYLDGAFHDIGQTLGQVTQSIRGAASPAGTVTGATFNQVLKGVEANFRTFAKAYNAAITDTATKPATDRTAFDAAVGTALTALNTNLAQSLTPLPASVATSLGTKFTADLLTSGGSSSLQARLAHIRTPSSSFFSTLLFRLRSSGAIGSAENQVIHQLITAVHDYNTSLTTTT